MIQKDGAVSNPNLWNPFFKIFREKEREERDLGRKRDRKKAERKKIFRKKKRKKNSNRKRWRKKICMKKERE